MALTRELKDYIVNSYDKKIKVLNTEKAIAESNLLMKRRKELSVELTPVVNYPEIQSFLDRVIALEKERDTLLIKLSLEKDFDRINEMLKQAGIALN